jgi:predicted TIM-barrel fold metal-dependent hydrolase
MMTKLDSDLASLQELDDKITLLGPVLDVDSHEMIPVYMWAESFGEEVVDQISSIMPTMVSTFGEDVIGPLAPPKVTERESDEGVSAVGDVRPVERQWIWEQKGPTAPSAANMLRRTEVLDAMGIDRQLVFPSFALMGVSLACNDTAPEIFGFTPGPDFDHQAAGLAMISAQNRWAGRTSKEIGGRARMVGIILRNTVNQMLDELEQCLANGVQAVWIPATPPAGLSPAHADLDPFWSACESAGIPVVLHVGTEFGLISPTWHEGVSEFAWEGNSVEFPIEPYRASIINLSCENFLGAMVFGGVFERHPELRFGVIECGAFWMGPLAEKLDLWAKTFKRRMANVLSMKPSAYLERNVRVTPYFFEPVSLYFERYPQVASTYCFSTDFPHVEGGKHSKHTFYDDLAGLGDDVLRKFFVSNGELLIP